MTDAKPKPTRLMIGGDTRVVLPRYIKLRHDAGRGRWVILAPERVFNPDETAVAVLKLCDGEKSVAQIAGELAAEYNAPIDVVTDDIVSMLQDLADKGVVVEAKPKA